MTSLFTHSAGHVYLGAVFVAPRLAHDLEGMFLLEGDRAAVSGDLNAYRSAIDLHHSLHDAMTAAALHSPDRWRGALGFLPSTDVGCAA